MNQTILIAVLMILCIVIVVGALAKVARNQTDKQRKMLEVELNKVAGSLQLTANLMEVFRNRIVAMDIAKKMLLYIRIENDVVISDAISLDKLQKCEVASVGSKLIETGKRAAKDQPAHFHEIQLILQVTDGITFHIVMYSEIEDGFTEMPRLKKKAIEWRDIIAKGKEHKPEFITSLPLG